MFSACSIPNTDISLDQNSVFIFFWFYTTMLTSPLTFGHSLLLMLECKTAQALKIKTEKLLEGKSYFMAVAFKKVTHVTGNAIGIAIWIFLAECLRKFNETTKLRIQTIRYLCMEFPFSLFDTVSTSATTNIRPVTLRTGDPSEFEPVTSNRLTKSSGVTRRPLSLLMHQARLVVTTRVCW